MIGALEVAGVELNGVKLLIYDCNLVDTSLKSHVVVYQKNSMFPKGDKLPKQVLEIVSSGLTGLYIKTRTLKPPKNGTAKRL